MKVEVLDLLLLATVRAQALHGYALIEELRRLSAGSLEASEGTVYPALHRLEQEGLLQSRWSPPVGRRRRVYRLTGKGKRALAEHERTWRRFAESVELVLETGG